MLRYKVKAKGKSNAFISILLQKQIILHLTMQIILLIIITAHQVMLMLNFLLSWKEGRGLFEDSLALLSMKILYIRKSLQQVESTELG